MATPKSSGKKRAAPKAKSGAGKSKSARAGLIFPVGRVTSLLRNGRYAKRVSPASGAYVAAVLEYLVAEVLELTSKYAVSRKRTRVSPRDITVAVRHDRDIGALLKDVTVSGGGVIPNVNKTLLKKSKSSKKSKKSN